MQHVAGSGDQETLTDVAELNDIPSPVKISSNGYAYDGPPGYTTWWAFDLTGDVVAVTIEDSDAHDLYGVPA